MERYFYLSLIPESLIASQLSPFDFGNYYAVGSQKRSRGQAIYFEVDPEQLGDTFDLSEADRRCVPHEDGRPRRSVYISIYRVLERIPLSALGKLYLTTGDGRVLGLEKGSYTPPSFPEHHLYQELCPVTPRVVSELEPGTFSHSITNEKNPISMPALAFCELSLGKLSRDPDSDSIGDLPYPNIGHLRDCLKELEVRTDKTTKAVSRGMQADLLYRMVKNGFFLGKTGELLYYPMPTHEQLEREYYEWWRSALNAFGE